MAHKALSAPFMVGVEFAVRQRQFMVSPRLVHCWTADLDDLKSRRSFQHSMPDLRRLQDAVSRLHHEWRALIFVHYTHPPCLAEDHLEAHAMVVNVIGYLATCGDLDVRSNEAPAHATGDEVAVVHSSASRAPGV